MPMATKFNVVQSSKVAMDLKQWNGLWILHIIDMWSRYTLSVLLLEKPKQYYRCFDDSLGWKIWCHGGPHDRKWLRIQLR